MDSRMVSDEMNDSLQLLMQYESGEWTEDGKCDPDQPMFSETHLLELLTDLIFFCSYTGEILYANQSAQRWSEALLVGQSLCDLFPYDDVQKAKHFLESVKHEPPYHISQTWELIIGTPEHYTTATFRGYNTPDERLVVVGHIEPEASNQTHHELNVLNSELAEAQREARRQNIVLQQALYDQRQLVRTVMKLSAPNVPIWDIALLLSMVQDTKKQHVQDVAKEIWQRAGEKNARFVIFDTSSITNMSKEQAKKFVEIVYAIQELGIQPLIAEAGSGMMQRIVEFGIDSQGLQIFGDVHQAIAYVVNQVIVE